MVPISFGTNYPKSWLHYGCGWALNTVYFKFLGFCRRCSACESAPCCLLSRTATTPCSLRYLSRCSDAVHTDMQLSTPDSFFSKREPTALCNKYLCGALGWGKGIEAPQIGPFMAKLRKAIINMSKELVQISRNTTSVTRYF